MSDESQDRRLCSISTLWPVVHQAHQQSGDAAREARHQLLERYGSAIRRYLMASLRDPAAVEELWQEFALRFLNGDFRRADPGRGRFRDYIKTILYHMLTGHYRRRQRQLRPLEHDHAEPAAPDEPSFDRAFTESWRDQVLANAWRALAAAESAGGPPHYTVLKLRAEHLGLGSTELAGRLGARLGQAFSAPGARQALCRARERFITLLIDEVAESLGGASPDRLEDELIDLGLFEYCRGALNRRRRD